MEEVDTGNTMPDVLAFTIKYSGIANVLRSKVGISANLELFPEAKLVEFDAIWDTGTTTTIITAKAANQLGLTPSGKMDISTAGGTYSVNTYVVDVFLPNSVRVSSVYISEAILIWKIFMFKISFKLIFLIKIPL